MNKQLIGWWLAGMLVLATLQVRAQKTYPGQNEHGWDPCPILQVEFLPGHPGISVNLTTSSNPPPIKWEAAFGTGGGCYYDYPLHVVPNGAFPRLVFAPRFTDNYYFTILGLKQNNEIKLEVFSNKESLALSPPPTFTPPLTQSYLNTLWNYYWGYSEQLNAEGCLDIMVGSEGVVDEKPLRLVGTSLARASDDDSRVLFHCDNNPQTFDRNVAYMIRALATTGNGDETSGLSLRIATCGCDTNTQKPLRVAPGSAHNENPRPQKPENDTCSYWFDLCMSGSINYDIKFTSDFSGRASFYKYSDPSDPSTYFLVGQGTFGPSQISNTIPLDSIGNTPLKMLIEHHGGPGQTFDALVYAR